MKRKLFKEKLSFLLLLFTIAPVFTSHLKNPLKIIQKVPFFPIKVFPLLTFVLMKSLLEKITVISKEFFCFSKYCL